MAEIELIHAEKISVQLFEAVELSNLITAGKSEGQLSSEICNLALNKFGIEKHWHKQIVRAGKNTLSVYNDDPPDTIIKEDDILFVDLGPIVDGYEADLGRTYLLGNNATKARLKKDVEKAWYETQKWFHHQTTLKASVLFQYVVEKAKEYGWEFGGEIAGHIVGKFPHEQPPNPKSYDLDIHPENDNDMFSLDDNGNKRYWILEIHFIDRENMIGGYFEQLL